MYSDKVMEMARQALRKYLELHPDSDLAMSAEKQLAWVNGYAHALHTLGIDLEDDIFDELDR